MTLSATKALIGKKREEKFYTLEEYLRKEERALHKSEFYNGKILPMPGAFSKHNLIATNIVVALKNAIKQQNLKYITFNSDQKIYIPSEDIAIYPDALVISEKPIYWNEHKDLIINPLLIVEVLSKSTRNHDKGKKFMYYRNLPSFKEYILIEQDYTKVELFYRSKENSWDITTLTGEDATILINSIGINILMSDIYENVDVL